MLVYSSERFIRAHEDVRDSHKNHSYDRYVKDAICGSCGTLIGEQAKYPTWDKEFSFVEKERNQWICCPFCGQSVRKEALSGLQLHDVSVHTAE